MQDIERKERERQLWADACRNNLWLFLCYAFGAKAYIKAHPDEQWLQKRIHKPACDWIQNRVNRWLKDRNRLRTPTKILIIWPRGFGKSTIFTAALNIWLHLKDPDLATVISSYDTTKAWDFLGVIQRILSGEDPHAWFTTLFGDWKDPNRLWRQGAMTHRYRKGMSRKDPSFACTSVRTGKLTGMHPDVVFFDDPVTEELLVKEDTWLDKVEKHKAAVTPALKTNGLFIGVATRYRDSDWLARAMREEKVKVFAPMMMKPNPQDYVLDREKGEWEVMFLRARTDDGEPTLPEIWPKEALDKYESMKPMEFAAQMMNEPGEGLHMPLSRSDIDRLWVRQADLPSNLRISIHLDTAFKSKEKIGKGDYSVIQVWGHSVDGSGVVYYLEGYRSDKWRSHDFMEKLVIVLQRLKQEGRWPFVITDEMTPGGKHGLFEDFLIGSCHRAGLSAPPYVALSRAGKKKEVRIREAAYAWSTGKVRLPRESSGVEFLVGEMLRIGISAHDDMADAAADVFHPDIYIPESSLASNQPAPLPKKPFDELMWTPAGEWSDGDWRTVYDEMEYRDQEGIFIERSDWRETWN